MTTIRRALPMALVAGLAFTAAAAAQSRGPTTPGLSGPTPSSLATQSPAPARSTGDVRRDTILRMSRRMSLEVSEARLEDVLTFIKDVTQADLEVFYARDGDAAGGLDAERKITLNIQNRPALDILEAVLEKARAEFGAGNTWQLTSYGTMQVGPREALNRFRRLETYDINDLLTVLPRYTGVPEIDLNSVLQQSQGGGGGQSPFEEADDDQEERRPRAERAKDIIDILIANVEPEQWTDNGGEAATIRYYGGTLLVNAPDYVHRQINGYPYWPNYSMTRAANGRRYLTLNADVGSAKIDGFGREPAGAVVGGRVITSGGGGGGR